MTTNILGDVVGELVGDAAEVTTIMAVGADPHDFQISAQQAAAFRDADLLVVNGAGFEEALLDVVEGAEADGVRVYEAISVVETISFEGDGNGGVDPHFFTDPRRMAVAAQGILDTLAGAVPSLDVERAQMYIDELEALDAEVEETLAAVPEARRVLVTNHEVFSYFADRYGFEIVGTVIPGGSTAEGGAAGDLADLAATIEAEGVPAIFADTSSADELAQTLAEEVGEIDVVELFSESLGEEGSGGSTYVEMVRTNAERIAGALA